MALICHHFTVNRWLDAFSHNPSFKHKKISGLEPNLYINIMWIVLIETWLLKACSKDYMQ